MNFTKRIANALLLALLPISASAATLTFDTGTKTSFGSSFSGSITENGFTYSTASGSLFLATSGNPGNDMEGNEQFGGGALNIVSSTASDFTFSGLDFSVYSSSISETITVAGYLNGILEGTDTYTLVGSTAFPYVWTTELASHLAGININDLRITLPAGTGAGAFSSNIDNVVLNPVTPSPGVTPEPSSFLLLGTGVLGAFASLKHKIRRS